MGSVKLSTDVVSFWPQRRLAIGGTLCLCRRWGHFYPEIRVFPRLALLARILYFTTSRTPLIIRCTYFMWQKHCQLHRDTAS